MMPPTVAAKVARKKDAGYRSRERAHFDALAEAQGEIWWGHQTPAAPVRMGRRVDILTSRLQCLADPAVLEVGCGAGIFTRALLDRRPDLDLTAMDISPKSIEVARARCQDFAKLRLLVGDATAPEIGTGAYDAIVGNSILHHIRMDEFLPVAYGALRPGGMLLFFEPNMMNPQIAVEKNIRPIGRWLQNSEDETAFYRWRLRRDLIEVGFNDVEVTPFDFLHPAAPRSILGFVERLGRMLERCPVIREIAGSLQIVAYKPVN